MSTRSARPTTVACPAGSNSRIAASAASMAAWRDAPIAHPSQFSSVRCASCSTSAVHLPDGCPATNSANWRVTGGAEASAFTWVLCAIRVLLSAECVRPWNSLGQVDVARLGELRPLIDVVLYISVSYTHLRAHETP